MITYSFYVYIVTNPDKTVLYTGMTNDLVRRLDEHYESRSESKKFAGIITATIWFTGSFINMFATQLAGRKKLKAGDGKKSNIN